MRTAVIYLCVVCLLMFAVSAFGGEAGDMNPPVALQPVAPIHSDPGVVRKSSPTNMILNGDFENTTAPGCKFNLLNADFNAFMANATAFGGGDEIDIMNAAGGCGFLGPPQSGAVKIAITSKFATGPVDAFSFDLSSPIVMGQTYILSFYGWQWAQTFAPDIGPVEIGISSDPTMFGTQVLSTVPSAAGWDFFSQNFVAPVNATHLTVRTGNTGDVWTHLDNFVLESGVVTADLDIKPGSCPNAFNVKLFEFAQDANTKKGGVMPVAILGSARFDVNDIDVSSILLNGVAPLMLGSGPQVDDAAEPVPDNSNCNCWEEGPDGFDDLNLKFGAQEIAAAIPQGQPGDDLVLTLTGNLLDGTAFEARDCIHFVGGIIMPVTVDPPPRPQLGSASPNPFNPVTRIHYFVPEDARVQLVIYNVRGEFIDRLVNGSVTAGDHIVTWEATAVASGVYFYRLTVGEFTETRPMVLLK